MDYDEAYQALEEFVNSEQYAEFEEEISSTADLHPDVEIFDDRAVFYVQVVKDSASHTRHTREEYWRSTGKER